MAGAVWATGRIQASAEKNSNAAIQAGQRMLIAMVDQETGLRGYINTDDARFLQPYNEGRRNFDAAITDVNGRIGDATDKRLLGEQVVTARRWQALAETELAGVGAGRRSTIA